MNCIYCDSKNVIGNGKRNNSKRYCCNDCGKSYSISNQIEEIHEMKGSIIKDSKTYVISSIQNSQVNEGFFSTLETYCMERDAELLLLPVGKNIEKIPEEYKKYLAGKNFNIHPQLRILGGLNISPTAVNPLSGLTSLSKGDTLIIGHTQLQCLTVPVQGTSIPAIMTTTGTVCEPEYKDDKSGYKASFNHSNSAVVVEIDEDIFHIRHLNYDGNGFFDIDHYYEHLFGGMKLNEGIAALVTGDEHAIFADPDVLNATYMASDSMVNSMNPDFIVRHDLLDCYSISHHHKKDVFVKYAKYQTGFNSVEAELDETLAYLAKTTPTGTSNIIVASNHNDHLTRWLNEADPKEEPWNALLYHKLMVGMLEGTEMSEGGATYPNPFELYFKSQTRYNHMEVEFLGRRQERKILDIEVSNHGDRGANGARGSRSQFAHLASKTIIGHSHSPGISQGCYQTGTSSRKDLEYNVGPSSWSHTHCIIHKNGKRQLINVIKGKWRR